jgi:hypothetical protein
VDDGLPACLPAGTKEKKRCAFTVRQQSALQDPDGMYWCMYQYQVRIKTRMELLLVFLMMLPPRASLGQCAWSPASNKPTMPCPEYHRCLFFSALALFTCQEDLGVCYRQGQDPVGLVPTCCADGNCTAPTAYQ